MKRKKEKQPTFRLPPFPRKNQAKKGKLKRKSPPLQPFLLLPFSFYLLPTFRLPPFPRKNQAKKGKPKRKSPPLQPFLLLSFLLLPSPDVPATTLSPEEPGKKGKGKAEVASAAVLSPFSFDLLPFSQELRFSSAWICPYDGTEFREPSPALFSFNNPRGACPACRGFGRTIEIDYERALPDRRLSIKKGVVKPWQGGQSAECQRELLKFCSDEGVPIDQPFHDLAPWMQQFVIEGDPRRLKLPEDERENSGLWYGVRGFFRYLEQKTYKMHVRVFLSRYRAYKTCPTCHGARFQPETLNYRLASHPLGRDGSPLPSDSSASSASNVAKATPLKDRHPEPVEGPLTIPSPSSEAPKKTPSSLTPNKTLSSRTFLRPQRRRLKNVTLSAAKRTRMGCRGTRLVPIQLLTRP